MLAYVGDGNDRIHAAAVWRLVSRWSNVEVFEGGLEDWKQAGHGVVGTGDTR